MLIKRFKQLFFIVIKFLLKEFYILRDALIKRKPREFIQRILRIIKDIDINDIRSQLNIIYINIDLTLRMYLFRSIEKFIINSFFSEFDNRKYK